MAEESWGRVAEDGTVFVRTKDGERAVGQWPDANPEEALAFYTRRYDALAFEVDLLEKRVQAGTVSPDDARAAVKKVTSAIDEAQAVGDLDGLRTRLEALTPLVAQQREKRKAERAAKVEEARDAKTKIATEAETIAAGTDWRHGVTRLRELLDEWKALPGSTSRATTSCGTGSPPPGRHTPGTASSTSPNCPPSATRPLW